METNLNFRPNPDRGVFLNDLVGAELLKKLTPEILGLKSKNVAPITLYIDSFGGNIFYARSLRELLRSPDQDGATCPLITVVTGYAASSAADLLAAGNYALAYPHARIICHGNRREDQEITQERAWSLAKFLAVSNEEFALQYAHDCIGRFIFRYCNQISNFVEIRKAEGHEEAKDIECFLYVLKSNVSSHLQMLLDNAYNQSTASEALDAFVERKLEGASAPARSAEFETHVLKAILDFELENNLGQNWSFLRAGMEQIEEKFRLTIDRHLEHHHDAVFKQCLRWSEFFLTDQEQAELERPSSDEDFARLIAKISEHLRPIWFLLVAIGRLLQKGEYELSAGDAYWFGLVDEVYGRDDLVSLREFLESGQEEDELVSFSDSNGIVTHPSAQVPSN